MVPWWPPRRPLGPGALSAAPIETVLAFLRELSLDDTQELSTRLNYLHTWLVVQDRMALEVDWESVGLEGPVAAPEPRVN